MLLVTSNRLPTFGTLVSPLDLAGTTVLVSCVIAVKLNLVTHN